MKSFIKVFCTILLLAVGATVFASPVFKVRPVDEKAFILYLQEDQSSEVKIRLEDENGFVLLSEYVEDASQYSRKYNLRALKMGAYSLIIENETSLRKQPITIDREALHIDADEQEMIMKPVIRKIENKVEVVIMPAHRTKAEMYIFDEAGHTLFSDSDYYQDSFRRRFDISQLERGKYIFKVYAYGIEVREEIVVE